MDYTQKDPDDFIANEPMATYGIPATLNPVALLGFMGGFDQDQNYLKLLKKLTYSTDDRIAFWLNMNVKTYRNHRDKAIPLKPDTREHMIMLLTVASHGIRVFGDSEAFGEWLETEQFHFDQQKPASLLNTNSAVRLLDDRLTGMEYGDNA